MKSKKFTRLEKKVDTILHTLGLSGKVTCITPRTTSSNHARNLNLEVTIERNGCEKTYILRGYATETEKKAMPKLTALDQTSISGHNDHYFAEELPEMDTMETIVSEEKAPAEQVGQAVAEAVACVHSAGYIYGGELNQHILYDPESGDVKIRGFGTLSQAKPNLDQGTRISALSFGVDKPEVRKYIETLYEGDFEELDQTRNIATAIEAFNNRYGQLLKSLM